MNYYEHHLGDYAEATAHLSILEDGVYSRLLRKYYASEKPLPADVCATQRLVGAKTKDERQAVELVLKEFFDLREDGWHQDRCDTEIGRYQAKSRSAKANANARWAHSERNANASDPHMRTECDGNAVASDSHDVGNALQSPVSNPQGEGNGLNGHAHPVKAKRKSSRVPPEFVPDVAFALAELPDLDVDREVAKFRDWEFKTPRSDWPAVWRNWIATGKETGKFARKSTGKWM